MPRPGIQGCSADNVNVGVVIGPPSFGSGGCGSSVIGGGSASAVPEKAGPSYRSVACTDNCGSDAQCLSKCQPASNNPPPEGLTPGK